MSSNGKTNWNRLLSDSRVVDMLWSFSLGHTSAQDVTDALAFSEYAGEFRNLVRSHGVQYARNLTRKALRYRGLLGEYTQ